MNLVAGKKADTAARSNLTREDWINAARQMLIKEGVAGVKVDRLAKKLKVTRGGFYWRFKNRKDLLDLLLDVWRMTNTTPMVSLLTGPGTPQERFRALMRLWIEERDYSPDFDSAVRAWSRVSPAVAKMVHAIDDKRIAAFTQLFLDAGYDDEEALIRARVTYFHQIGYYAMGMRESRNRRWELSETYYRVLSGFTNGSAAAQALDHVSAR